MPADNYTHAIIVLDASGSMGSQRGDTVEGLKAFLNEQAALPGRLTVTLAQFSGTTTRITSFSSPGEALSAVELYRTGGSTALLDAIGGTVTADGAVLASLPEVERPGLVILVILTDGEENSSTEWTHDRVKLLLEQQQCDYSWQVAFLGADLASFAQGSSLGSVNNSQYKWTSGALGATSSSVGRTRSAYAGGVTGQGLGDSFLYTEAERKDMETK